MLRGRSKNASPTCARNSPSSGAFTQIRLIGRSPACSTSSKSTVFFRAAWTSGIFRSTVVVWTGTPAERSASTYRRAASPRPSPLRRKPATSTAGGPLSVIAPHVLQNGERPLEAVDPLLERAQRADELGVDLAPVGRVRAQRSIERAPQASAHGLGPPAGPGLELGLEYPDEL